MKLKIILFVAFAVPAISALAQTPQINQKLSNLNREKDSVLLNKKIDSLYKTNQETDLLLLFSYFSGKKNQIKTAELNKLIIERFPNGNMALNNAVVDISKETNGEENEKKYKALISRFGSIPALKESKMFESAKYYVAMSYKNNPSKTLEYLNLITDPKDRYIVYNFAAGELIARKDFNLAETVSKIALEGELSRFPNKSAEYYEYAKQYSTALFYTKKYLDGLKFAREAYSLGKKGDKAFEDIYVNLLVANKLLKEAFPLMEENLKSGRASSEVKANLKAAYVAYKGSEEGYIEFEKSVDETVIGELSKQMIKEPAFNFVIKDLNGKTVSLSDFKGKTVILDFWAMWCVPCKASFPQMQAAVSKYKDDPSVVFLFIHTWEKEANPTKSASDYIKSNNYTFNVLMDLQDSRSRSNKVALEYKLSAIPAKFVIDGNGDIRFKTVGSSGKSDDAFIDELGEMIKLGKSSTNSGK